LVIEVALLLTGVNIIILAYLEHKKSCTIVQYLGILVFETRYTL